MQYLITQEELNKLIPAHNLKDAEKALDLAKKIILRLSNVKHVKCQKYDSSIQCCINCPLLLQDITYHVQQFLCSDDKAL